MYRLHTNPVRSVIRNSDESFPMHTFQTQQQFSKTYEGFEQQVQFQTGREYAEHITGQKLEEIGALLETSPRKLLI
jgi:hypothetical protein